MHSHRGMHSQVEDFCALNSSLRCLIASLGAMARKGAARPPLRDSKLTRVLSGALGKHAFTPWHAFTPPPRDSKLTRVLSGALGEHAFTPWHAFTPMACIHTAAARLEAHPLVRTPQRGLHPDACFTPHASHNHS